MPELACPLTFKVSVFAEYFVYKKDPIGWIRFAFLQLQVEKAAGLEKESD